MSKSDEKSSAPEFVRPAAAPVPSKDNGSHAVDSQGVRKIDSEDAKSHGLSSQVDKKRGKTLPRFQKSPSAPSTASGNHFRQVALSLPFREKAHPSPNLFIPSFGMMFHILASMNDAVCAERPFGNNGTVSDWIPQISVIVFSILGFIQVYRAQEISGNLDNETTHLLNQFCSKFPLDTLTIPGPLVPFFRSLSVASPGYGNYQDVTPWIPRLYATEQHFYNLEYKIPGSTVNHHGITMLIPNLILLIDQFRHLITHLLTDTIPAPHTYSNWTQLETIFGITRPSDANAIQVHFDHIRKSVGLWHRPAASDGLMARFAAYIQVASTDFPSSPGYNPAHSALALSTRTPARAATWITTRDPSDFLQLGVSTQWFDIFLKGMSNFNRYWKGNVSLADLVPTSSTAGLILFKQVRVVQSAATGMFSSFDLNASTHHLQFTTYGETTCPFVPDEDLQDAQVAQVNITSPDLFRDNRLIGEVNVTRFGEFWLASPPVLNTATGNLTESYQNMVTSPVFFTDV
uniref:Coat protein n=1 Tax=uncultured partitivirus TaxID=1075819 RepID=A0A024H9V4_9VIRU|nr:coat protein [uncultured partitivirus]